MALSLYAAPTLEPVDLDEAKAHCNVDVNDDDELIRGLIAAARQTVETHTRRALCEQTWDLKLDTFTDCHYYEDGAIVLPFPPVSSITSITYLDTSGDSQTWSSSLYRTDLPSGPHASRARITPAFGVYWPSSYSVISAVTIRFVCGYGDANDVPEPLKAAIKMLVSHWYRQREPVTVGAGNTAMAIPITIDHLLWPFRAF